MKYLLRIKADIRIDGNMINGQKYVFVAYLIIKQIPVIESSIQLFVYTPENVRYTSNIA